MKNILITFVIAIISMSGLLAQSNDCATATPISLTAGSACVNGTTSGATSDNILYSTCNITGLNEVWYTYIADGSNNDFTITSLGLTNAQIVIYTGGCGVTLEFCNNVSGATTLNSSWGMAAGTQVWIGVMSNEGSEGNFELCVDSYAANPTGGNTCAGAIPICAIGASNIIDMTPLNSSGVTPSCFLGSGNLDLWVEFTVTQAGTIEWSATPEFGDVEMDWALYDMAGGCPGPPGGPGTLIACNYNYGGANGDPIGMNDAVSCVTCPTSALGIACEEFCSEEFLPVGTYAIMIDLYEGTAGDLDFMFTNGTTALISPVADFTVSPTLVCGPDMTVGITDNSIGSGQEWTFGNGDTYSGSNPPDEFYDTPGTYAITTSFPLDQCPTSFTQFVQLLAPLSGTATGTNETCVGNCNGTATIVSILGGDGVYTYEWFDGTMTSIGQTGLTATGLCPDTYTVTISNAACGSSLDLQVIVGTLNPIPTINLTPTDPATCNGTNGSILVSGSSTNPVTVTWSGPASDFATGQMLPWSITGLAAGTYTVNYTDETTTCTSADSVTILINPNAPVVNDILDTVLCGVDFILLESAISGPILTGNQGYYTSTNGVGPIADGFVYTTANTPATVYIYDVDGLCSDEESFTITIITPTLPTFTAIADVCQNDANPALLGTSLNGYTGTWSPAVSTATVGTTTYTFTPTAGQCATTTTLDIAVTAPITPTFAALTPVCQNDASPVLLTTSLNGYTGTWSPAVNTATLGTTTYTFTPTAGQCAATATLDLLVNTPIVPTFTVISDVCQNDANPVLLTTSLNGYTGTWSPAVSTSAEGTTTYTFTPDAGQCATTATLDITVTGIPLAPTAGTDSEYCSTVSFDAMTASGSGGVMTWYSDATLASIIATSPTLTPNGTIGSTVYYVTETVNGCEGPASEVVITVNQCDITIPTAFTPDADGSNDDWEILDIDAVYPENIVYVYNRWGNLLFTSDQGDYDNSRWNGTFKGSVLPVGSYYFIIEFNDEEQETETGVVSIILNK